MKVASNCEPFEKCLSLTGEVPYGVSGHKKYIQASRCYPSDSEIFYRAVKKQIFL